MRLPGWLKMDDLNDLKARVIQMIILVAAVTFTDVVVESKAGLDTLYLGTGVAVGDRGAHGVPALRQVTAGRRAAGRTGRPALLAVRPPARGRASVPASRTARPDRAGPIPWPGRRGSRAGAAPAGRCRRCPDRVEQPLRLDRVGAELASSAPWMSSSGALIWSAYRNGETRS
jgi:hypothetical protein